MAADPRQPLKPEHCECLNRVLQSTVLTRELIEKLKRCGLPMDQAELENESDARMAANLKREFFPNAT